MRQCLQCVAGEVQFRQPRQMPNCDRQWWQTIARQILIVQTTNIFQSWLPHDSIHKCTADQFGDHGTFSTIRQYKATNKFSRLSVKSYKILCFWKCSNVCWICVHDKYAKYKISAYKSVTQQQQWCRRMTMIPTGKQSKQPWQWETRIKTQTKTQNIRWHTRSSSWSR